MSKNREYLLPISLVIFAIALLMFVLVPTNSARGSGHELTSGTRVVITQEHLAGVRLAWAFVETKSESELVLCSFNENDPGYGAPRLAGLTVFCRPRTFDDGNLKGVGIAVFMPGTFQPPKGQGFALDITVFHAGAVEYGELLPCPGDC